MPAYKKSFLSFVCVLFVMFTVAKAHTQEIKAPSQNTNGTYALEYLTKAAKSYAAGDYAHTLEYVRKGQSYNNSLADFSYLEAQCLMQLGESRAKALAAAEQAAVSGLTYHVFDLEAVTLLLGQLYVETCRYTDAITMLDSLPFPSADSDFYYAWALYGLGQEEKAREHIAISLDRWSFDPRFPTLFFLQERSKPVSRSGKRLADMLMQQLPVWLEREPSIAVYAAPFDPNPRENNRRLKIYRNMYRGNEKARGGKTQLSAILAELRYGVIDEKTAVKEFFSVKTQHIIKKPVNGKKALPVIYSDQLIELCSLVGMVSVRQNIADRLKIFTGVIVEDENHDGILSSAVFFEQGRPVSAFFDPNQDETYDYQVICNFGAPDVITTAKNGYTVRYDTYPAIRSIVQKENKATYTLRPFALRWEPVEQHEFDLNLKNSEVNAEPFFTLRLRASVSLLQESDILFTTLYRDEPSTREKDTFYRTHFEKGSIISVETRKNAKTVAHARYRNGTLVEKIFDYDEDGFFEVTERYNQYGEIEKIAIDINKNKLFEYYELYDRDGKIVKNWDENEDGIPEIQYTQFPSGEAETVWQRRFSGQSGSVLYQNGAPAKLTIGSRAFQLIKEDSYPLYWLGKRPHFSDKIAEKLLQVFNESTASVESYTAIAGNDELYAVRSGGYIFVELFPIPESEGGKQ